MSEKPEYNYLLVVGDPSVACNRSKCYIVKLSNCDVDINHNVIGELTIGGGKYAKWHASSGAPGRLKCKDAGRIHSLNRIITETTDDYTKNVLGYLEGNLYERVSLFDMLDQGLILTNFFNISPELVKFNHQVLVSEVASKKVEYGYTLSQRHDQGPPLFPIPNNSPPEWKKLHISDSGGHTSEEAKIHIYIKKEFLGEALKTLFEYPKFFDYFKFLKFNRPDFRHCEYKYLNEFLSHLKDGKDVLEKAEVNHLSTANASIIIYPVHPDIVDIETIVDDFLLYWRDIEEQNPEWKKIDNYSVFNIRLTDTVFFAMGSATALRIGCMEGSSSCDPYTEPPIITKLKRDYCKPENEGKVLPCLSDAFNINNYEELCDHSGTRSLSGTYGIKGGKDFPSLYGRIKDTECYKDLAEEPTMGGGKRRNRKSKRKSKRRSIRKKRKSKRKSKRKTRRR